MTNSQKVQVIVKKYFRYCSDEVAFCAGKPSKNFWALRGFLLKQDKSVIDNLYEFMEQVNEDSHMTIGEAMANAEKYMIKQKEIRDKEEMKNMIGGTSAFEPYSVSSILEI